MPDDYGHDWTERKLSKLESRISAIYSKAEREMRETVNDYFVQFQKRDAQQKRLMEDGVITRQDYTLWRAAQLGRGKRLEVMREKLAQRYTQANEEAAKYINDQSPGVYALNRNYISYEIETTHGGEVFDKDDLRSTLGIDFLLFDEDTVKRLIKDDPDLMPYYPKQKAVDRGIDLEWGRKQITAAITSSILQGKSLKNIADDLQKRMKDMNRVSAIRTARTAMTAAQNAGRQDGYTAAKKLGIDVRKRWIATKDFRTRHDHAVADGQVVPEDETFNVGGYEMMFPGDQSFGAPGRLIYNCRCTMRTVEKPGIEAEPRMMRVRDANGRNVVVPEMTYVEWEAWVKERGL